MAKITMIDDLLLVKNAMFIGKTSCHFHCVNIAAILFTLPAAECQGRPLPDINSAAADF